MYKLTEAGDLEKAAKGLASYFGKQAVEFEKSHSFHKALGDHHAAMSKAHGEHAAMCKAHGEALSEDHELKAHMAAGHEFHKAMSTHHDNIAKAHHAHAETMKTEIDALKAYASEWGGPATVVTKTLGANGQPIVIPEGGTIDEKLKFVTDQMMTKAMQLLETDPRVAEKLQHVVLEKMGEALGKQLVPDNARSVIADNPTYVRQDVTPIIRPGQPEMVKKEGVPVEFEHFLKIEE